MEQLAIVVTGCLAIWLVNEPREALRKWASVIGLVGQPFWFYTSWMTEQWGIFAVSVVYTAAWLRGFRYAWLRSEPAD